jgi:hypothetical protein
MTITAARSVWYRSSNLIFCDKPTIWIVEIIALISARNSNSPLHVITGKLMDLLWTKILQQAPSIRISPHFLQFTSHPIAE